MHLIKKILLASSAIVMTSSLYAANWLMIQGTEPAKVRQDGQLVDNNNTMPRITGFIQATYMKDFGSVKEVEGINKTPYSMIPPNLESQSGFNIRRARVGVRGMIDEENKINYFLFGELGNNGVTNPANQDMGPQLLYASATFKHLEGAYLRTGLFKIPQGEEAMRTGATGSYICYTSASFQLLLERYISNDAVNSDVGDVEMYTGAADSPVNANRDIGLELFYTYRLPSSLELSYALMIGNGTGLQMNNTADEPNYYGYLSLERLFGAGKGYFSESLKGFTWYQSGKRRVDNEDHDRIRYGLGVSYFHDGLRLEAEWMKAKGMIYNGAKDVSSAPNVEDWHFQIAADKANEADGGYINAQYFILPKKLEIGARYDYLNRMTNSSLNEREFRTTTFLMSYYIKDMTRVDLNYAIKKGKAPGNPAADTTLDNMGDRLAVQLTLKF